MVTQLSQVKSGLLELLEVAGELLAIVTIALQDELEDSFVLVTLSLTQVIMCTLMLALLRQGAGALLLGILMIRVLACSE